MSSYLGFNLSPSATSGQGAYGAVPGNISAPPSIYQQIGAVVPGLSNLTSSAASNIQSELSGQISPATMGNISNYAAARGVALGQPNSNLSNLIGMNVTGTTTEQLQQQGQQNYLNFLSGVGGTQLSPDLLSSISQYNATMNAAPDPTAAANNLQNLMSQYMNMTRNPSGNPSAFGGAGLGTSNPWADFPAANRVGFASPASSDIWNSGIDPFQVYNIGSGSNAGFGSWSGLTDLGSTYSTGDNGGAPAQDYMTGDYLFG